MTTPPVIAMTGGS